MQFRDHPAVAGKRDFYPIDPRKLRVDDSYNVRDMNSKETREHVAGLKASIAANGVKVPLEVRLDDKTVFVVAGHCRLAAVMQLIAEGVEIETVPCIPEGKGTSEIDRVVNLVVSNSGKPLAPLEIAQVVKRLDGYGWSAKQIAERLGWKSVGSVKQHLDMLEMPETVKQHVRDGNVSATTARNIAKGVDPKFAAELIEKNLEENRRIKGSGKRSTKVTTKTLKRDTKAEVKEESASDLSDVQPIELTRGFYAEPAQEQETSHAEPQSLPATAAAAPDVHAQAAAVVATAAESLSRLSTDRTEPNAGDAERDQGVVQLTQPVNGNGMKAIADALLPFARISELNNLDEFADDYVHEISNRDIKRAAAAWFKATGLTTTGNGEQSEAA